MASFSQRSHRLMLLDTDAGSTPPPRTNGSEAQGNPYSSEATFDSNMVIILATLLCALICALGLNCIVRYALRCCGRFSSEIPGEVVAHSGLFPAPTGLKKSVLRKIPVAVYGSGVNIPTTECPICLAEFAHGVKVRILPKCNHGFHVTCIDTWLLSQSSCPTCRQSLPGNIPTSNSAVAGTSLGSHGDVAVAAEEVS